VDLVSISQKELLTVEKQLVLFANRSDLLTCVFVGIGKHF